MATALLCSGDGRVSMPNRPLAVAGLPAGTTKPANGTAAGFSVLSIAEGGFALGDAVSGGGRELVVPAKGLYLAALMLAVVSSSGHRVTLFINGAAAPSASPAMHRLQARRSRQPPSFPSMPATACGCSMRGRRNLPRVTGKHASLAAL